MARLTIGMPLYNNGATLAAGIESLLAQSFTDFHLLLSDDASTDATAEIAQRYAKQDGRIQYIRQPKNLGYYGNWRVLVDAARTEYFMLAPGDDRWAPGFALANIRALDADPSRIGSISRVVFTSNPPRPASGTYPIDGETPKHRLVQYLARCGVCDMSRNFGLYRTQAIQEAFPPFDCAWFDIAMCAKLALAGKIHEVPEVLMFRDKSPPEVSLRLMHKIASPSAGLGKWFPGLPATRWLRQQKGVPRSAKIALGLFAFNVDWHFAYTGHYHPPYARLTRGVRWIWDQHVGWRCRHALRPWD